MRPWARSQVLPRREALPGEGPGLGNLCLLPELLHPKPVSSLRLLPSPVTSLLTQPLVLRQSFSRVRLFATLWTVAHQAPLSMEFSRQEYWSGLPFPPPGDFPDLGIKPMSLMSPSLAGGFFTTSPTWEVPNYMVGEIYFIKMNL